MRNALCALHPEGAAGWLGSAPPPLAQVVADEGMDDVLCQLAIQGFRSVTEFCQGPCPENQRTVVEGGLCAAVHAILCQARHPGGGTAWWGWRPLSCNIPGNGIVGSAGGVCFPSVVSAMRPISNSGAVCSCGVSGRFWPRGKRGSNGSDWTHCPQGL